MLDNCEHLLDAVAALVERRCERACPERRGAGDEPRGLGIAGERILAVRVARRPRRGRALDAVARQRRGALFVERAQAVKADFALDDGERRAVAQICRRLDGIPLAIELAAARVPMMTPAELAARLDQRFRLLTGGQRGAVERHQTLRAAIDWSYDLLDERRAAVARPAAVFAGGCTLEAAEAVSAGGADRATDVFELLAGLVARSLVQADAAAPRRATGCSRPSASTREEHLDDAGETESVRAAHARWCAGFVEDLVRGPHAGERYLDAGASEADNVRAGCAWAVEVQDVETLLRFFSFRGGIWPRAVDVSYTVQEAAPRALEVPGVADDPRHPLVLVEAAFYAAHRGQLADMARYRAVLESCEPPLDAEVGVVHRVRPHADRRRRGACRPVDRACEAWGGAAT